jgi:catechol 2,3-dioxygenase-like lactoylglutathione lyase family enzyme
MRIGLTSSFVDDQDQAEQFYRQALGLQVKTSAAYGPGERWLSVVALEDPDGIQVEVHHTDERRSVQRASRRPGRPVLSLRTDDCAGEVERLKATGVVFVREPARAAYGGDGRMLPMAAATCSTSTRTRRCRAAPPTPSEVGSCWRHAASSNGAGHKDRSIHTTATRPIGAALPLEPLRRHRSEHLEHSLPDEEEIESMTTEDAPRAGRREWVGSWPWTGPAP